jgi:hypothetical protein
MPATNQQPPKTQRRFPTQWGELDYVCKRIHFWLYHRESQHAASRYLSRLEGILKRLPKDDLAILRQEGLALLHELKGQTSGAIDHRQREIQLTERLHKSVRKSVECGDYDDSMAASILAGRDGAVLEQRRAVLRALQEQLESGPARKQHKLAKEGHTRRLNK